MRNRKLIAFLFAPLLGCFAQVDAPELTMTRPLCATTDCVPGGAAPLTIIQVSGANTFTVDFGDQPLLKPSSDLGPATLNTSLILNSGAMDMITAGSGADFSQVQTVTVFALNPGVSPAGDPCATAGNCTIIASYNRNTDPAATRHLDLKGNGSDLVKLIDQASHSLTLEIQASGQAPSPALWNANVSMDMSLTSRASYP